MEKERSISSRGRKIVVAVDESEESMYALSWCLNNIILANNNSLQSYDHDHHDDHDHDDDDFSTTTTTTLVLLYVKPPPPVYSAINVAEYLFGNNDVVASMEEYTRKLVEKVMCRAQAICINYNNINIKVEKKVGSGDAKQVICGTVDKLGAHMLVMGSHGYGFFKRALLGSVSYDCAKQVKCPVVVVKHPKNT